MLKLAGSTGSERVVLDGFPIPLDKKSLASPESGEHVNVEFWGFAIPEGKYAKIGDDPLPDLGGPSFGNVGVRNNTYKALRLIGDGYNILYTVYCFGDKMFYDLNVSMSGPTRSDGTDHYCTARPRPNDKLPR